MSSKRDLTTFFQTGVRQYLPHLSVDCVVFGFHESTLKLLLLKWKGARTWMLPGGYIRHKESLDAAAHRVLRERAGLRHVYLRQFHAFGGLNRKESSLRKLVATLGVKAPERAWPLERVVSVGYFALVDASKVRPAADQLSDTCEWHSVDSRPKLAFDHDAIVETALDRVRSDLDTAVSESSLLPDRFTMPDLQRLHEAVLGSTLDRRNFQKRMLDGGTVERLVERRTGGGRRSAYLYRFTGSITER